MKLYTVKTIETHNGTPVQTHGISWIYTAIKDSI
jgi:hypothetical protein